MKRMILAMALLVILSGCADGDRYNFSGSSENWDVLYVVDIANNDEHGAEGTMKYTGEDPAPELIDFKFDYSSGSTGGEGQVVKDGVAKTGSGGCEGCAAIQEDEEIEVEIIWNGQTENLMLTTGN